MNTRTLAAAALFVLATPGAAQVDTSSGRRISVDLTIYNQNLSLVREERLITLAKGLGHLVIPDIPAGKNVFIHGKGMYGAMVCIAWNYVKNCKSLSVAAHETDYTCAVSFIKEREVGDVTHRTLQNNL